MSKSITVDDFVNAVRSVVFAIGENPDEDFLTNPHWVKTPRQAVRWLHDFADDTMQAREEAEAQIALDSADL